MLFFEWYIYHRDLHVPTQSFHTLRYSELWLVDPLQQIRTDRTFRRVRGDVLLRRWSRAVCREGVAQQHEKGRYALLRRIKVCPKAERKAARWFGKVVPGLAHDPSWC